MKDEIKLFRHILSSIDLSDVEELKNIKISDNELQRRAADAEIFYMSHFEKVLKLYIQKQLEFIANEATDIEKLSFGRGTINGLILINQWFEERIKESRSRFDEQEEEETGEIKPV